MISTLRRAAIRTLTTLIGRRHFDFDGGKYIVFDGVLNPTLFRASLIFAREALAIAGSKAIDILELGSGSGLASIALARRGHHVTAVDRSLIASLNTVANAKRNDVGVRTVCSNWDNPLQPRLTFDLVITNPPFLTSPTPVFEDALWGGPDLKSVEEALTAAMRRLRRDGRVLLLTSENSGRNRVLDAIRTSGLDLMSSRTARHWGEDLHLDLLGIAPGVQLRCPSQP